jgi:hypothetical protein
MVQGIASLDASQTQPEQQDQVSPEAISALGKAFNSLSVEEITQLRKLSDLLKGMSPDKQKIVEQIIVFLKTNSNRYDEAVQILVTKGIVEPGDLPPDYVPSFFHILEGIVKNAMSEGQSEPEMEEGFARGGIAQLRKKARDVAQAGTGGDKILAHINPREAEMLYATRGGGMNPHTGLPEYGFFDDIGNFFKKAAGVVLPVALGFMGVPPIFAGAIGSGLGAMINGAKPQDALGAALMGGVGGAVFSGISNMGQPGGFMAGVSKGFEPGPGILGEAMGYKAPVVAPSTPVMAPKDYIGGSTLAPGTTAASNALGVGSSAANAGSGFFNTVGNFVSEHPYMTAAGAGIAGLALGSMGSGNQAPSMMSMNGPSPEQIAAARFPAGTFDVRKPPSRGYVPTYSPAYPDYTYAAEGGQIDARVGGHLEGPGTGTSDSIPAKLSDGEFVMTAKAVRGAGAGDRKAGAKRMYQLMHQFEKRA